MQNNTKSLSTALLLMVGLPCLAQRNISKIEDKDGQVKIHIESSGRGKNQIFEQTYATKGMTSDQKENLIKHVTDSVFSASISNNHRQLPKQNDLNLLDEEVIINEDSPEDLTKREIRKPRTIPKRITRNERRTDKTPDGFTFDLKDFDDEKFLGSLKPMMKDFKLKFNDKFKDFDPFNESKTIKGLAVYPNKPFDNKLNLKFFAPQKGDVNIIVTDVNAKEIGNHKIKDFEGDFMGQIELKKSAKGTLFITITQGEDGTVKRFVIE